MAPFKRKIKEPKRAVSFFKEYIEKDLESWETEFPFQEVLFGDFLAEQLTRRTQNLLYMDERIHNTFAPGTYDRQAFEFKGADHPGVAWDSNYGRNYHFDVKS